ncbi:M15 family metallopeptidase domain-containing protein [Niabella drilacis]|nr:M15 family metallopeptidase [Niabella drilacis]
MKKIVDFYISTILKSAEFNSPDPVANMDLLLPDFKTVFATCVQQYKNRYPDQDVTFTETYRSNVLQEKYYNDGASKVKKDGMHHFGIAGDSIFIIGGKKTYKGDVNLLRKIYNDNGLTILGMWDPLHVQYIPVAEQQRLRDMVSEAVAGKQQAEKKFVLLDHMEDAPYGVCTVYGEEKCYRGKKYICDRNPTGDLEWAAMDENC